LFFQSRLFFLLSSAASAGDMPREAEISQHKISTKSKPLSDVTLIKSHAKTRSSHPAKKARQLMLALVAAASTQFSAGSHHMSAPNLPQQKEHKNNTANGSQQDI